MSVVHRLLRYCCHFGWQSPVSFGRVPSIVACASHHNPWDVPATWTSGTDVGRSVDADSRPYKCVGRARVRSKCDAVDHRYRHRLYRSVGPILINNIFKKEKFYSIRWRFENLGLEYAFATRLVPHVEDIRLRTTSNTYSVRLVEKT